MHKIRIKNAFLLLGDNFLFYCWFYPLNTCNNSKQTKQKMCTSLRFAYIYLIFQIHGSSRAKPLPECHRLYLQTDKASPGFLLITRHRPRSLDTDRNITICGLNF